MRPNKEKTKVLFRVRSLEMGGVTKVLLDILTHLPKENLEISVLTDLNQGELRNEIPDGIHYRYIAQGKENFSRNPQIRKIQLGLRLLKLKLIKNSPFLLNLYYKEKYDVEIAFGKSELEMVLQSPQKSSKKIAWVHWEFSHEPVVNKLNLVVSYLQKFDQVIFCSDKVRKQVKELYQVDLKSTSVIHNVIHPDEIRELAKEPIHDQPDFTDDLFTFISVGRVQDNKGYPLLLDIHKKLWKKGLKHRIIIIGEGVRLKELKQRAKDSSVEDNFIFLGNKNNPFPYLKNADFFILPTQTEAYPLSVKEALVMGIPVLVSDVGGVNEIVCDGIDGILMTYDENEIFDKMEKILTQPKLVKKLKSGAENAHKNFDTFEIYNKIEQLLLNLSND